MEHSKKGKPTDEAPCIIHNLPLELITEILTRLPVKPLLQFKCVSKYWLALISSPEFIKAHLRVAVKNKNYRLVLQQREERVLKPNLYGCSLSSLLNDLMAEQVDLDHPVKNPQRLFCVAGSANGLICLVTRRNDFFLWNPSTRKFKKLPGCRPARRIQTDFVFGFGYDEIHDDYNIVCAFCFFGNENVEVKVYSLNSDSWRRVNGFPFTPTLNFRCTFVKGKFHWVERGFNGEIVSFDLADEWGKLELPHTVRVYLAHLQALGSDLSAICSNQDTLNVWVMKEYGVKESWTKTYSVKYPSQWRLSPYSNSPTLCIFNKCEVFIMCGTFFMIHNLEDGSIRYTGSRFEGFFGAHIYIETLVCPFFTKRTRRTSRMNINS